MTYDFELRLPEGTEAAADRLRVATARHAKVEGAEGGFVLALPPSGRASLRVMEPAGATPYVTAGIELGAPAEEAGELLERLLPIASDCGAKLVDPQLGRAVGASDRPAVERRYTEAAEFAVRWTGRATDPRGFGAEAVIPRQSSTLPTKALLGLVAIVAAAFWAGDAVLGLFMPVRVRASYYEPGPGEPPAWWQVDPARLEPPLETLPVAIAERLRAESVKQAAAEVDREIEAARREAARVEESLRPPEPAP